MHLIHRIDNVFIVWFNITSMFIGVFLSLNLAVFVSLLFVAAMFVFIGALLAFLRKISIVIKNSADWDREGSVPTRASFINRTAT